MRHSATSASRAGRRRASRRPPDAGPTAPGAPVAGGPASGPGASAADAPGPGVAAPGPPAAGGPDRRDPPGPGGGRRAAAPGRQRWRQLPYAIVLCGLVLALVWMRQSGQDVRGGTLAVAGILFAAALARLALPERRAGMLASRRRLADVAVLTALGTGLLVAGLMLPAQH
jgi:Protein of unknown function (DUF3017)